MENVSGVLVRFKDQIFSYMNVPGGRCSGNPYNFHALL